MITNTQSSLKKYKVFVPIKFKHIMGIKLLQDIWVLFKKPTNLGMLKVTKHTTQIDIFGGLGDSLDQSIHFIC